MEATLRHLELDGLFACAVTRDEVRHGKPAPDLFLLAARQLGVEPAACVVLEDADSGLLAAARAGMAAVDVRRRWTRSNPMRRPFGRAEGKNDSRARRSRAASGTS